MTSHTDNHTTTDGRDALWLEAQRRAAAIFGDDQTDAGTMRIKGNEVNGYVVEDGGDGFGWVAVTPRFKTYDEASGWVFWLEAQRRAAAISGTTTTTTEKE